MRETSQVLLDFALVVPGINRLELGHELNCGHHRL
jgi:hypothetical protein